MDDQNLLLGQFVHLTLEYKKALVGTWSASVSMRSPATAESVAALQAALAKEEQIDARRREVLSRLLDKMRSQQ